MAITKEIKLHNSLFSVHPDKLLKDVKKTDLIFIPALSAPLQESLAKNSGFLPWIREQYMQGAEVASLCIGGGEANAMLIEIID